MLHRLFPHPLPGVTTWAEPGKAVYLKDNATGRSVRVGVYDSRIPGTGNQMALCPEGFGTLGIASLRQCGESDSEWISIDEIGYLETGCPEYCDAIRELMGKKRLIAAVRKQSLPFLEEICRRDDVFLIDLDAPFGNPGCVIMASGLGRRFGGNKLMAGFRGKPLIQWALDATGGIFRRRIVVTRHPEVEALCRRQGIPVILHDLPYRSDTVCLGLQEIMQDIDSCLFCPGDQPLLRWDTVASLALNALHEDEAIWRTAASPVLVGSPSAADSPAPAAFPASAALSVTVGSPVLFPKWAFPELLTLPEGKGGSSVLKKYPGQVRMVPVRDKYELMDVDTPEDLKFLQEI